MNETKFKPKSIGAYLNENALSNLEFIQRYFKRVGYNPSNSGIIQSSLSVYARFLSDEESNHRVKTFRLNYPCSVEVWNEIVSLAKSVRPNEIKIEVKWRKEDER